jgi:hypothetical protein
MPFRHSRRQKVEETDMSDIAERVKKIVVDHLGVDAEKVVEGASFIDDLGADSLDPDGRRRCKVHRKGSGLIEPYSGRAPRCEAAISHDGPLVRAVSATN